MRISRTNTSPLINNCFRLEAVLYLHNASNSYLVQSQIYTRKPLSGSRQINVGERTVLNLVCFCKNSGRNVTTVDFFTTMELARVLIS